MQQVQDTIDKLPEAARKVLHLATYLSLLGLSQMLHTPSFGLPSARSTTCSMRSSWPATWPGIRKGLASVNLPQNFSRAQTSSR